MTPNPLLGVLFHWLGGLSSASFYVPYRGVRRWSWEIFWLTGGLFSWLLAPWLRHATRGGQTVPGGTVVTTGTWCGMLSAAVGDLVTARFEGVGQASVQF